MKTNATTRNEALLAKLLAFCATTGRACYGNYSPEVLADYLMFHARHNSLRVAREGERITGCGVIWRVARVALLAAHNAHGRVFTWQPDDPAGDCLFLADFICTTPAARATMWEQFTLRYPNWRTLNWYTYRRGQLVRLNPAAIQRLTERQR